MQNLNWLIKGIRFRFLNAGQEKRCWLKNKKLGLCLGPWRLMPSYNLDLDHSGACNTEPLNQSKTSHFLKRNHTDVSCGYQGFPYWVEWARNLSPPPLPHWKNPPLLDSPPHHIFIPAPLTVNPPTLLNKNFSCSHCSCTIFVSKDKRLSLPALHFQFQDTGIELSDSGYQITNYVCMFWIKNNTSSNFSWTINNQYFPKNNY